MISKFIKTIGKGVMYIFLCPLLLFIIALFSIVGLFIFIFLCIKSVFLFFYGKTIFSDLPEDVEARGILNSKIENNQNPVPSTETQVEQSQEATPLSLYPSDSNMYKSEYSKVEESSPEISNLQDQEDDTTQNISSFEKKEVSEMKIENEEIIGTYTPLSSNNKEKK